MRNRIPLLTLLAFIGCSAARAQVEPPNPLPGLVEAVADDAIGFAGGGAY